MAVRAVVTTAGQGGDVTSAANVVVAEYAPHAALLPFADVVVAHAGLGTIAASLDAGVPLVCLPFDRDQPLNASRIEALGAGVIVSDGDDLGAAIGRVLDEASFRSSVDR
jgi:UDP:flavonoid glycosyltransferase YjiC (YdhE family)